MVLQNQCYHYFNASQCELELKLLETSHFAVAASLTGFKVTAGESGALSKVNMCVCQSVYVRHVLQ